MRWTPSGLTLAMEGQGSLLTPSMVGPGPVRSPHPSAFSLPLDREGTARMGEGRRSGVLSGPGVRGGAGVACLVSTLVGVLESHRQPGGALCAGMNGVSVQHLAWGTVRRHEGGGVVVKVHILSCALFRERNV